MNLRGTDPAFYRDRDVYEAQREQLFPRTWHFAADVWRLPESGYAVPYTLLGGCLDEPLVLTRQGDKLHALGNVCTHRGAVIVTEEGPCRRLRCPYHGRRFGLDGAFEAAPGFEGCGLPRPQDHLSKVDVSRFGPLLFVSLDPVMSLDELIGESAPYLDFLDWSRFAFDAERSVHYPIPANWALYVDNYLEGMHIPYVHPALAAAIDIATYEVHCFEWSVLQVGEAREGEDCFDLPVGHPHHGRRIAAYYLWLFPGTMLNFYPWGLSLNVVQPVGPEACRISYLTYVSDPEKLGVGAGADVHQTEFEDQEVVSRAMRGMRSRFARPVQYAPMHEDALRHFHDLCGKLLG
ncbi:MAG: aromatic ring-hydroxylating dioxygenase subunit alpha [Deltaproteobacteria bacterium]|nr:MAG: aromatic ring-hydroxylating dioxygenase subunit alpha [Deltaproteobacteria bacterium]